MDVQTKAAAHRPPPTDLTAFTFSARRRIRHETVGERLRILSRDRPLDDALRDEVPETVVVDRDLLGRPARRALEGRRVDVRVLACAVAGAEPFVFCDRAGR